MTQDDGQRRRSRTNGRLHEQYRELARRYTELVRRREQEVHAQVELQQLSRWALRSHIAGIALVRFGELAHTNVRWNVLDRAAIGLGRWTRVEPMPDGANERSWQRLREVVFDLASELNASGGRALSARFEVLPTGPAVDVKLERTDQGPADVLLVMAHDITRQRSAERRLELAEDALARREQSELLVELGSGIAHDVNTLLAALRFQLEALSHASTAAQRAALASSMDGIIERATRRVGRMQLLATRRRRTFEKVDVIAVVSEAVDLFRRELAKPGTGPAVKLVYRKPARQRFNVTCDRRELSTALLGLLLNARDAMPEGGILRVRARVGPKELRVEVRDQGPKLSAATRRGLLQLFPPELPGRPTHGLWRARRLMTELDGELQGRNVDGGVEFSLSFPAPTRELPEPPTAKKTKKKGQRVRGPLLFVDDDADLRASLLAAVGPGNGLAAATGAEALKLLRERKAIRGVVCDLALEDTDGWALSRAIRKLRPSLPVVLLSGWAREVSPSDPRRKLVRAVLAKPVHLDQLFTALND